MATVPYRVVASDMDGTLLNKAHCITEYTKATLLRLAVEKGVKFIFATGRHHLSVTAARTDLSKYFAENFGAAKKQYASSRIAATGAGEHVPGFYLVTSNGARVHDPSGQLIITHNLEPSIVRELYQTFGLRYTKKRYVGPASPTAVSSASSPAGGNPTSSPFPSGAEENSAEYSATDDEAWGNEEEPEEAVSTSTYTTDKWYITSLFMSPSDMQAKFGIAPTAVPFDRHDAKNEGKSVFDSFPLEDVGKVCFRCSDKAILKRFEKEIHEMFGDRVSVALSSNNCLDVTAASASKGKALQEICALLTKQNEPVSMKEVITFGDSMNDCSMLMEAGKGCLMRNAQARLKEALPDCEIIGTNEEDGVAHKLRQEFGIPE